MKTKIKSRLEELETEYQKGQERMVALEQELASVKSSMLRISGAMQVLQEMLESAQQSEESELVANGANNT